MKTVYFHGVIVGVCMFSSLYSLKIAYFVNKSSRLVTIYIPFWDEESSQLGSILCNLSSGEAIEASSLLTEQHCVLDLSLEDSQLLKEKIASQEGEDNILFDENNYFILHAGRVITVKVEEDCFYITKGGYSFVPQIPAIEAVWLYKISGKSRKAHDKCLNKLGVRRLAEKNEASVVILSVTQTGDVELNGLERGGPPGRVFPWTQRLSASV